MVDRTDNRLQAYRLCDVGPEVGPSSRREKSAAEAKTWLVGDVGATHSRFGLVMSNGELLHSRTLVDEEYRTIDDALAAFLA